MHVAMRALVKVAAHTGDSTSLDWHPKRPFVLATGGSGDRCVKGETIRTCVEQYFKWFGNSNFHSWRIVWDLENCINVSKKDYSAGAFNANNTWNTAKSEVSNNSHSSSETEKSR
jgi:hypothetical protein